MGAVVLDFPDRRGNRPAPINPPQDVVTKVATYCVKLGLGNFQRAEVARFVSHLQACGRPDDEVASRSMAMANRMALCNPDPNGPRAA